MDAADLTTAREEREAPYLLAASRKPAGPVPTGRCTWCDDVASDTSAFCDQSCMADWERDQAAAVRRGRAE